MADDELVIEHLRLRVGGDPAEARALAEEVACAIGELLADQPPARWGGVELRVDIPRDLGRSDAARRIAEAIVKELGR